MENLFDYVTAPGNESSSAIAPTAAPEPNGSRHRYNSGFDIRDYTDRLEPRGREKNTYHCPACGDGKLTVAPKTGKYNCWHCGDTQEIARQLTAPDRAQRPWQSPRPVRRQKKPAPRSAPLPETIVLARLDTATAAIPQQDATGRTVYPYGPNQWTVRLDKPNGKKDMRPWHRSPSGVVKCGKGDEPWPCYREDEALAAGAGKFILACEGEKDADTLRGCGYAAITPQGGCWGPEDLQNTLQRAQRAGVEGIVYFADNDKAGRKKANTVSAAAAATGLPCVEMHTSTYWKEAPEKADITDFVKAGGNIEDAIATIDRVAVEQANAPPEPPPPPETERRKGETRGQYCLRAIESLGKLRYNKLFDTIEAGGKHFARIETAWMYLIRAGWNISQSMFATLFVEIARMDEYSPVEEYLNGLPEGKLADIEAIASQYLGTSDPIYDAMVRKFLIAAVARALDPGCKVDTVLFLQGKQGIGKSSFFRILASDDWFCDSIEDVVHKDELLKVHSSWIAEWSELEMVFRRRNFSKIKAHLTSQIDIVRRPYARNVERMQRAFVYVGSTNEEEFLFDSTGNRRFWVIPISGKINLEALRQERDRIWAAALAAYKAGESWVLTEEEEARVEELRKDYRLTDPWQPAIEAYIASPGVERVTTTELLERAIGLDIGRCGKGEDMRVGKVMLAVGWKRVRRRVDGVRRYFYEPPQPPPKPVSAPPGAPATNLSAEPDTAATPKDIAADSRSIPDTTDLDSTAQKRTTPAESGSRDREQTIQGGNSNEAATQVQPATTRREQQKRAETQKAGGDSEKAEKATATTDVRPDFIALHQATIQEALEKSPRAAIDAYMRFCIDLNRERIADTFGMFSWATQAAIVVCNEFVRGGDVVAIWQLLSKEATERLKREAWALLPPEIRTALLAALGDRAVE